MIKLDLEELKNAMNDVEDALDRVQTRYQDKLHSDAVNSDVYAALNFMDELIDKYQELNQLINIYSI